MPDLKLYSAKQVKTELRVVEFPISIDELPLDVNKGKSRAEAVSMNVREELRDGVRSQPLDISLRVNRYDRAGQLLRSGTAMGFNAKHEYFLRDTFTPETVERVVALANQVREAYEQIEWAS